jgi:DNA-binding NtrC family response regulator
MKKILVIDDESLITSLMYKQLQDKYDVITENSGRKALETIKNNAIDLIITDVIMPDFDGIHLLFSVMRDRKPVPVIVMSGDPVGRKFLYAAHNLGAVGVLTKPFTRETLLSVVGRALESDHEVIDAEMSPTGMQ